MATFTPNDSAAEPLLEAIQEKLSAEHSARSTDNTPHVSELIYCLRKGWRRRQESSGVSREAPSLILLTGQMWDRLAALAAHKSTVGAEYLAHYQINKSWVTGEADGVARVQTEDGFEWAVWEHKTTGAGQKNPAPLAWPHWVEQAAAYQALTRLGTRVFLAVLHLTKRELRVWDIRFKHEELMRWEIELQRRATILMGNTEPDSDERNGWECRYCPYFQGNGGTCHPAGVGRLAPFFTMDPGDEG